MNRLLVLVLGFVIVLGATGYARGLRVEPGANFPNPRIIAGVVNADGSIVRGSHFWVSHLAEGHYRIHLQREDFADACPALTATGVGTLNSAPLVEVRERQPCRIYDVYLWIVNSTQRTDGAFNFIAAGTE